MTRSFHKEEETEKMLSGGPLEDKKWSEKMVEGEDDGLRTVDCLRGRLLAERVTSKAAKEDAELMGKRLIELERKLMEEIESKKKAEKKLKFAMKKLESLKLLSALGLSTSSENEGSSSSSTCCNSENTREKPEPWVSQDLHSVTNKAITPMPSPEGSWTSVGTACSNSNGDFSQEKDVKFTEGFSSGGLINDAHRQSPVMGKEKELGRSQDQIESKKNELAFVPASMWYESEDRRPQMNSEDIHGVLVALRHAKEHLQSSMGRRAAAVNVKSFESCMVCKRRSSC